jgi:hypothetical protein
MFCIRNISLLLLCLSILIGGLPAHAYGGMGNSDGQHIKCSQYQVKTGECPHHVGQACKCCMNTGYNTGRMFSENTVSLPILHVDKERIDSEQQMLLSYFISSKDRPPKQFS